MKRRISRWTIAAVTLAFVGMLLPLILVPVTGEEVRFSPWTLQYQTRTVCFFFSEENVFYRKPWIETPNEVVDHIRRKEFVVAEPNHHPKWLYIKNEFHKGWPNRDEFALAFLQLGRSQIIEWSKSDPERAKLFWSEGFRLLRANSQSEIDLGVRFLEDAWRCESISGVQNEIERVRREVANPP